MYRLLAIDIDGTLVNSRDELTEVTRAAIQRATQAGIRVVLATGRRYSRTLHLVAPLGIDVPLITASGALVKDPADHRTLFCAQFNAEAILAAARRLDQWGFDPVFCSDTFREGFDFYHACHSARRPELAEYLRLNPDSGRLCDYLLERLPQGVFAAFTMGTRTEMLEVERQLQREFGSKLNLHVLRSPRYVGYLCEIAPEGVTKWSAVQRLAADWGIDQGEICAVGDDVNDIPMIQGAALGIAMGNALPEVKAVADLVVGTHDEDGLVEVVERLLAT